MPKTIVDWLETTFELPVKRPLRHITVGELCDGRSPLEYNIFCDGENITNNCVCADEKNMFAVMVKRSPDGGFECDHEKAIVVMELKRGQIEIRHESDPDEE